MRSSKSITLSSIALAFLLFAPQLLQAQYSIKTVAGGGPNNLTALNASVGVAGSTVLDLNGNTYVADAFSSRILKIDPSHNITIVAGNGTVCPLSPTTLCGDGGPATSAALNHPESISLDASGNIFIADSNDDIIRAVNVGAAAITIAGVVIQPGAIATVAGDGTPGYSGDGHLATSAQLLNPYGVFVDSSGNIFIADSDNAVIRAVNTSTAAATIAGVLIPPGAIATVAGSPGVPGYFGDGGLAISAQLGLPQGVFVDPSGNIFIADTFNSVIREVTISNNNIQTVAGTYYEWADVCNYAGDGGLATVAYLCLPSGVFVDASENIFIADTFNSVIREFVLAGNISTVAGNNALGAGYSGDGGLATSAQLNTPSNIFVDGSENILIADTDNFVIREVTASNSDIATVAGNNTAAWSGDGNSPADAELNYPAGVFVDGAGDIFIADSGNSVIREVLATTGDIQTVAGNAILGPGYSGDGAAATSAQLDSPEGVFVDSLGNIFIADTYNSVIREVVAATGDIQTVAGNFNLGAGYAGDGGLATSAQLNGPFGVFVDSAENIFIADTSNSAIREVTASSGDINTVAGNGQQCTTPAQSTNPCGDNGPATTAQLAFPTSVFVDLSENVYIANSSDNRIRAVNLSTTQTVTVAGVTIPPTYIASLAGSGDAGFSGDGGLGTSALLNVPNGVYVDAPGDVFIADTSNQVIREITAADNWFIQTVAGTPLSPGFMGDGAQGTSAELYFPYGLSGNAAGDLFIADTNNQRIRELVPALFVTVTPASGSVVQGAQLQFTASVTGTSNAAVSWSVNGVVGGNATVGTISNGLFQAPATIPTPPTVTITALSQADNTTSGSAQATIVAANGSITVAVSPTTIQIYTSTSQQVSTQQFSATVTGTTNQAVSWFAEGAAGGDSTYGTIDTTGLYTAPSSLPSPTTVTIAAYSQQASNTVGSATVTIVQAPSAAEPAPQTIAPGGSATYSLLLNENVGWTAGAISLSCLPSTLPPSATCSFSSQAGTPITTITPGPQAVPFTLTITVPSGSASLRQLDETPSGMRPQIYFAFAAFVPMAGLLLVSIGRRNRQQNNQGRWLWLGGLCIVLILLNACGGSGSSTPTNPELGTYNVKVQGTTAAHPQPATITIAGLTVQSQ
jgi:trimeric autotransporter adhesin